LSWVVFPPETKGGPVCLGWKHHSVLKVFAIIIVEFNFGRRAFSLGWFYQPRLKVRSLAAISGHVNERPLVPAPKLNRD
jgi:hypothetical protein